ncbi:FadR/GntR family transcriptional regulator [Cohnella silvisoli]|uniref:FadR/GntR family transcriptional regulator n=1 Tax=Cohnella silvisoli TaxID=2873699 RepID=A0ABV1KSM0_9BACL|nr:FadR/GntR family transcriptional regulator [Cohnella silvisoli]MCD9021358.1 FadR family transcriptional regulator [Cohnella silvisoli]
MSERAERLNAQQLSTPSLAERTSQLILDAIVEGKIKAEESFPSQYQLTEWFGVSRTVIREATQILVSKGILNVKHGKRITIRPASHEQVTESLGLAFRRGGVSVLDVLALRKALEVESAGLAALHATDENLAEMRGKLEEMERYLLEEKGYVQADVEFHETVFTAAGQPAFELVLRSLTDYLMEIRKISFRGEQKTKQAADAHRRIYEAIEKRDEEEARRAMRVHLEETEDNLRTSLADLT